MKTYKFLLLLAMIFCAQQSWATPESEPNNTKATANTLNVNGSNSGAINVSGDEDWFAITTTQDGKLDVTITISNSLNLRCYIYDNDGTTVLSSGFSSTSTTVSKDGLAAGTYFIKLIAYSIGQLPVYTVSNTLTEPAQTNDAEPNNSKAQAKVLPLNNSKSGHVGYYYNLVRDTADWYKITTNADGLLRLTLNPANGNTSYVYL
ncbi:MAG: T9SS type A sorting domain-containing protein, partial [Bacteroidota bacterium]